MEELTCPSSLSPALCQQEQVLLPTPGSRHRTKSKVGIRPGCSSPEWCHPCLWTTFQRSQQCPKALPAQLPLLRALLHRLECERVDQNWNWWAASIKAILSLLLPWFADIWQCAWCYLNKIQSNSCTCISRDAAPVTEQDVHCSIALLFVQNNLF